MRHDHMPKLFDFETRFSVTIPTKAQWNNDSVRLEGVCVYTDGSKRDGRAGSGIYSSELDLCIATPLGEHTTVFQAEVFSIMRSAELLLESNVAQQTINILSDSHAVLSAIKRKCRNSLLLQDCCMALKRLSALNRVHLVWVPAHSGIDGNSRADVLAKSGSRSRFCGPEPMFGLTNKSRRSLVHGNAFTAHQQRWRTTGTHMKRFISGPSASTTRSLLSYSRSKCSTYANILTGHCFNKHLHKLHVMASPVCRFCLEDDETVLHVTCECPALCSMRKAALGSELLDQSSLASIDLKKFLHFAENLLNHENENHI